MLQAIPSGVWTKLNGYELDVHHNAGHTINVSVEDGKLVTSQPDAIVVLRPRGPITNPWTAPLEGSYHIRWQINGSEQP